MKKGVKLILFDFDGCIADTTPIVIRLGDELAPRYLKTKLNLKKVFYNEGLYSLIKKSKCKKWRLPFILRRFRKGLAKYFKQVKPVKGMPEAIRTLYGDYTLGIISSNSKKNIFRFLDKHNLLKRFDTVTGNVSLFTKAWRIKRIARRYKIPKNQIVFIGDEMRDVQAAKKAKVKSIAVTWGMNSKQLLTKQKPDYIVKNTKELLKAIDSI